MEDKKILSRREWFQDWKNHDVCGFEHIMEDQDTCFECGISGVDGGNCPLIHEAYDEYIKNLGIPEEMLVLMGVDTSRKNLW